MEITINEIITIVCDYLGVHEDLIQIKTRKREVAIARQMIHYFCYYEATLRNNEFAAINRSEKPDYYWTLYSIGKNVGNRDSSTVWHSCKTVTDMCQFDKHYKFDVLEIEKLIDQKKESLKPATYVKNDPIINYINKKVAC